MGCLFEAEAKGQGEEIRSNLQNKFCVASSSTGFALGGPEAPSLFEGFFFQGVLVIDCFDDGESRAPVFFHFFLMYV